MAAKKTKKKATKKRVEALTHDEAKRTYIPTAEYQPMMVKEKPIRVAYERRNRDLDPQLVWRGKDEQDLSDLVVPAPPLYIQEKVHPKVLIDDLVTRTREQSGGEDEPQVDLFADFNGIPEEVRTTDFYKHEANWTNRMILGDSLQVMASLAEREGLRGKVQCIYIDPPYGIKFNSNFQWSTTSRDVKDGKADHITREPEQVKAFRDTWRDGVHSYLTYLRERLTCARELLSENGAIFVQIGDENIHRVRGLLDEVFGEDNFVVTVKFSKTAGLGGKYLDETFDYILWYARDLEKLKFRRPYQERVLGQAGATQYALRMADDGRIYGIDDSLEGRVFAHDNLTSQTGNETTIFPFTFNGNRVPAPTKGGWKSNREGVERLIRAGRVILIGKTPRYVRFLDDAPFFPMGSAWLDTGISGFAAEKLYVVQTLPKVIERCILMTTDPGDLVFDPTCGSGTTAYVAEQWGRRWITIDTSRVALALARARIMGARFRYHILTDSRAGQLKEAEVTRSAPSEAPTHGDIRLGFVYERVPHIMLKSVANNAEIDVICEEYQQKLEPLRQHLNELLNESWDGWEIPLDPDEEWPDEARAVHREWWDQRVARQKEIDASIAAKAGFEDLYDRPYEDKSKVRVPGPFTVESLSPHRVLTVDEDDELVDGSNSGGSDGQDRADFAQMILDNLQTAGVQQAHKEDKIEFSSLAPWPGRFICAEGRYTEEDGSDGAERRAGVLVGPEFGTVRRTDLVDAAREAADAGFDVLISCAFNYEAHASEFSQLGRIPVLKARMNADLHMADDLKNTGKGNLFVIFGEPDIDILPAEGDNAKEGQIHVKINGVDVFDPQTGEVRSDGAEGIACWFIDTDYNEESFFVRHAYFLGANDPYKSLKTTLKAEINQEAWETLHSDTSRPFDKPKSGRIAVKVINHLGDEVMKVFRVE